jgi:hypothetical protein
LTEPHNIDNHRLFWENAGVEYGLCLCGCGEKAPVAVCSNAGQMRIAGEPSRYVVGHSTRRSPQRRFWEKVDKDGRNGCWVWTASLRNGYGHFGYSEGDARYAHRLSYEWLRGDIPVEMTIDHLCRNRLCVNPDHLEVVSRGENARRGLKVRPEKTHCPRGHPYVGDNVRVNSRGARECRTCKRTRWGRST